MIRTILLLPVLILLDRKTIFLFNFISDSEIGKWFALRTLVSTLAPSTTACMFDAPDYRRPG